MLPYAHRRLLHVVKRARFENTHLDTASQTKQKKLETPEAPSAQTGSATQRRRSLRYAIHLRRRLNQSQ